uniref:Eukaryotic translation initiation factor 6 n=1 Tax=Metchnikovella dogieli TaxID=2804710 RepID=A0A896WRQ9_9MICR|nr:eukaryotic translation initiation factor6 [Metchnikovella dogieli]
MASRVHFENSNEIGVFSRLTNTYCLTALGGSQNFYSTFESELKGHIPLIQCSIAGTRLIGTMTTGNRHGLLVSGATTDQELQHLRSSLPDGVAIQRIDERLCALGNIVACNDYSALVHPEIDRESEEIISDVLQVDVFRQTIACTPLVGTYSKFTNNGGMFHPKVTMEELDELSSLLQIPLVAGTVNRGSCSLGAGLSVNDWTGFVGMATTSTEISVVEGMFRLEDASGNTKSVDEIYNPLLDTLV